MALQEYTSVDPLQDPDQAQALTDAATGPKEKPPTPRMPDPPDTSLRLPGGLWWDEEFVRDAEVRELNGADEEAIAKAVRREKGAVAAMIRTLLTRAVVAVGSHEPPPPALLDALLVGDRDALLLAIRRATYGNELELQLTCPNCDAVMDAVFDLVDDIPVKELPDSDAPRVFDVELQQGRKARVVLPCGADQEGALSEGTRTAPEINTQMLSSCVLDIDGQKFDGVESARMLGIRDRRAILKVLGDNQPGPRYEEVTQVCLKCEYEFPLGIDLPTLFRGSY